MSGSVVRRDRTRLFLGPGDWDDCVEKYLGKAINAAMGPFFKLIFKAIQTVVVEAVNVVLQAVGFLWIYIKTPDVSDNGTVSFIQVHTNYILGAAAFIAVVVAGDPDGGLAPW